MEGVYQKFLNGDSLSNQEILDGIEFFEDLTDKLDSLGERFRLQANECLRVTQALKHYKLARGLI